MKTLATQLFAFAKNTHQEFAHTVWRNNHQAISFFENGTRITPCYHNGHHIIGVVGTARAILTALIEKRKDPLCIEQNLANWNQKHTANISLPQFSHILQLAFATHDLGNLTKTTKLFFTDAKPYLQYSDRFQLEVGPSEQRSAQLAIALIEYFDTEKVVSHSVKDLVTHLILQTVFHPSQQNSDEPFWLLMQCIDQVGSYFFSEVPVHHATAGYLNELYTSGEISERTPLDLHQFLTFLPNRFEQLLPNRNDQQTILEILDPKNTHSDIFHFFSNIPDRKIDYQTDVEAIYKGVFNRQKTQHSRENIPINK